MRRTLYLNENEKGIHVVVDGPSLLIKSPHVAERRVPIGFLGRVVIFGNIIVETDALNILGANDIPVFFISKWASHFSISLNVHQIMEQRCLRLAQITKDRWKSTEFFNWMREKRAFLETEVLRCLSRYNRINNTDYRDVISFFMPLEKEKWRTVYRILKMLFWSLIIEELVNRNLHPHYGIINRRGAFGLVRDCLYVMSPEIVLQALQFFRSDSIEKLIEPSSGAFLLTSRGIHNIVARFENKQYVAKKITKDITDKLFELAQGNEG